MSKLILANDKLTAEVGGQVLFDTTQNGLFNLAPSAAITLSNYTLTFPDLAYEVVYYFAEDTTIIAGSTFPIWANSSWTRLIPGEYGPTGSGAGLVPDINLGALPAGTNYLDVRASLTRTKKASWMLVDGIFNTTFVQGQEMRLEGGSLECDQDFHVRRLLEFRIVGGDLILRRRMSVEKMDYDMMSCTGSTSAVNRWSSLHAFDPNYYGPLGTNIDDNGFARSGSKTSYQRGGSNGASLDAPGHGIDYSVVYNCNFTITPGYVQT